jgi:tetratricopeptide (TPR) repeat protein
MADILPDAYLLGLIALLGIAAVVVARQILKVRGDEMILARLGSQNQAAGQSMEAASLYELASVQLRKRLYGQAAENLKLAIKRADAQQEPSEARALIENALGFSLAAQNNYKTAIRHYRLALQAKPDYPVALNNLAFALEKLLKPDEAKQAYDKVLELEPGNQTARKRLKLLGRQSLLSPGA